MDGHKFSAVGVMRKQDWGACAFRIGMGRDDGMDAGAEGS